MSYRDKEKQKSYQREWIKKKRAALRAPKPKRVIQRFDIAAKSVEPSVELSVEPKHQSYNPMMVGYVPPSKVR